jgi:RNA polymerase sigma-70 factor (ECF subfamily)
MQTTHEQDSVESALLHTVAEGDQAAFERIYQVYEKRLYQYIMTLVNDPTIADDIFEETMMAIWRGAGTFVRTSRVSTWIFGIARHKALDALRRTTRQRREVDLDGAIEIPSHGGTPLEGIQQKELATVTHRALAALSREHQEVLRLAFFEDMPYEVIAQLLTIPINTVKTRVFYAKQQLKVQLEQLGHKELI